MKKISRNVMMKRVVFPLIIVLCIYGFYLGLNIFKDTHAEPGVTPAASYYRYKNRYQTGYKFTYYKSGYSSKSSKSDIGYMNLAIEGKSSNLLHVFCARRGKSLSTSVNYYRYNFDQFYSSKSDDWRKKLSNIVALYSPSVTPISTLKTYLATNYPTEYTTYGLENLTNAEASAAFQTAIWTFTNGDHDYKASTGNAARNNRLNALHIILLQSSGYLKNINNSISSINFSLNSDLALNATSNKYEASIKVASNTFNQSADAVTLALKTNNGTVINSADYTTNYTTSGDNTIMNIVFNNGALVLDGSGRVALGSNNEIFDVIYITTNVIHGTSGLAAFVYKTSSSSYQSFVGGENVPITSQSFINLTAPAITKVSIEVDKVDEDNLSSPSLSNSHLQLYRVNGTSTMLIDEWLSASSNRVINDLQPGTYRIVETLYPEGYENSTAALRIDGENIYVSSEGDFTLTAGHAKFYVHVLNKKTEIKIRKVDTSGTNFVSGAVFSIIDSECGEYYRFESTTDDISIKGELEVGTYFMVELEAPTNYIKSDKVYRFTVGEPLPNAVTTITDGPYKDATIVDATYNATTKTISITNEEGISISKKSIDDDAISVIGATLKITDSTGKVIDSWVTTKDDHVVTVAMPDGKYTLTETIPAPGYATAESISFEIVSGKVVNNVEINMKDAPLQVCIAKKSTNSSGNIAGAEFEMYDSSNKLVTTFTSTSEIYCADVGLGLKPGEYTLKEIKAPVGYKGIKQQVITVRDTSDLQTFEVLNEVEVPRTDLNTTTVVYIAVIIMGVVGIGLVCYYVKRYNY